MDRKDWTRIGIAAAVVLVPGGFVLGAMLAARRVQQARAAAIAVTEPLADPAKY